MTMNEQDINFIETEKSLQRINIVYDGIRSGIPILLEGETGTSKTRTAIKAAIKNHQKPIVFSFSSQTTIEDMIGRMTKDTNSWSGFGFKYGPYTQAFMEGDCLILDEINLAHETVLQCIEASLDSGKLSLETSSGDKRVITMHKNFHIIATMNPPAGRFAQKRSRLTMQFRSRFRSINFLDIEKEELLEIALGLAQNYQINDISSMNKLVDFHFSWKEKESNQIHVFTIREISGTIKLMKEGLSLYESILIQYGSRYSEVDLQKMKSELQLHGIDSLELGDRNLEFQENLFYRTNSIMRTIFNSIKLLNTNHSILITGPDGCGKTAAARWISYIYHHSKDFTNFFICNPEISVSDIIGRYMPIQMGLGEAPIVWIDGPLIQSVQNGHIFVMDQVNTAPTTILERINPLFDNIGSEDFSFEVQENSETSSYTLNPKFRIIAVSNSQGLSDLSPALLNRFAIVYLDEQHNEVNFDMSSFIKYFLPENIVPKETSFIINQLKKFDPNSITTSRIATILRGYLALRQTFTNLSLLDAFSFATYATSGSLQTTAGLPDSFVNIILSALNDDNNKDENFDIFHFKQAKSTKSIMAVLVAASVIGIHVILVGKTGLGKTSAALALARLSKFSKGCQCIAFNGETQLDELYGSFAIANGQFIQKDGPLAAAISKGDVFIADELNLADPMVVQSLNVVIESNRNDNIILPITGARKTVDESFFFIGCQNHASMHGRKQLPKAFTRKILMIEYPENTEEDLLQIVQAIATNFNLQNDSIPKHVTRLIQNMKENEYFKQKAWSLREVRKLFRRTVFINRQSSKLLMRGFTVYHNAAFLLQSAISEASNKYQEIAQLIKNSFELNAMQAQTLLNDLQSPVKIQKRNNDNIIMVKNNLQISITNSNVNSIPFELTTFWNTLFNVSVAHPSEPLLLVGPSEYKTFLATFLAPLSHNIYLHSDTTIGSLVGQISLLERHQAKTFLIDSLFDFVGFNPSNECLAFKKSLSEMTTIGQEHIDLMKQYVVNHAFDTNVETIMRQIISINDTTYDASSVFSNYVSIFQPGVITKALFRQNSLILKNIAHSPPNVLERLNELLAVKPILTLTEDTSNTFTPENHKILAQFTDNSAFRIIGTCNQRDKRGLSDAMLSRLTEIEIQQYAVEDQKRVVDSILTSSNFTQSQISKYHELLDKIMKEELSQIPFIRLIEIVKMTMRWQQFYDSSVFDNNTLFSLALFRCGAGPLYKQKKQEFIASFFKDSDLSINDKLKQIFTNEELENQPNNKFLLLEKHDESNLITSPLTNLYVKTPKSVLPETTLCFTPSMKDLIDVILTSSAINQPLLLQGPNGTGKSTAFFYLAECINAKVTRISLSSSTTVEDLFGKYEPRTVGDSLVFDFQSTNFLNAIQMSHQENNDGIVVFQKQWIIIEELHLASSSVLDALIPVFNRQATTIMRPDGTVQAKGEYFIVGCLSKPIPNHAIINTSLHYTLSDYTNDEYRQIYSHILKSNDISDDIVTLFCEQLAGLSVASSSLQLKIPITAREAYKFIHMIEGSNNNIEYETILRMLCLNRFSNIETRKEVAEALNYSDEMNNIDVTIDNDNLKAAGILTPIRSSASAARLNDIKWLTNAEKNLFAFLSMTTKKYTPIIIQGPTASGKTYALQLFADIIGHPLRIVQLNSEVNSQTVTGHFQPKKSLNQDEIETLQKSVDMLIGSPEFPSDLLQEMPQGKLIDWTPSDFKNFKNSVEKAMDRFSPENRNLAELFIQQVTKSLEFYHHIQREDSVIVKAMLNGEWLLLDGIESAPSDFFDRLFTLIDDEPVLNLYERGKGFVYSTKELDPQRRIHPNFRLIMTYNPNGTSIHKISPSLLSRCTLFSMQPIDTNPLNTSLIIFSFINDIQIQNGPKITSIHLAYIHQIAKRMSVNYDFTFTGRNAIQLCRSLRYFGSTQTIDREKLIDIITTNYNFKQNDVEQFLIDIKEQFTQPVDETMIDFEDAMNQQMAFRNINQIIKIIQDYSTELFEGVNYNARFDFINFLNYLIHIENLHYPNIGKNIQDLCTKAEEWLNQNAANENINKTLFKDIFAHLSSIKCLQILLNNLIKAKSPNIKDPKASLESHQLQEIEEFKSLYNEIQYMLILIEDKLWTLQSLPLLFFEQTTRNFLSLLDSVFTADTNTIVKNYQNLMSNAQPYLFKNENMIFFLDAMKHFYVSANWPSHLNTVSKQIVSCIFFHYSNLERLFTGIARSFYIFLQNLLNEFDIHFFNSVTEFIDVFYNEFQIPSSITFEDFVEFTKELEINFDSSDMGSSRRIREVTSKIPRDISRYSQIPEYENIMNVIKRIQEVRQKCQGKLLAAQKDKDAISAFSLFRESILRRKEQEPELGNQLQLLYDLTEAFDGFVNTKILNFLQNTYQTIQITPKPSISTFIWPDEIGLPLSNKVPEPLIDCLISYSKKIKIVPSQSNWMTLCSIEINPIYYLEAFLQQKLDEEFDSHYKTMIKSRLLSELAQIPNSNGKFDCKYCSTHQIIDFLNRFGDRKVKVNENDICHALYYEMNADKDFLLAIPTFTNSDIVPLLINPINKNELGFLFTEDMMIRPEDQTFIISNYNFLVDHTKSINALFMKYLKLNQSSIRDYKDFIEQGKSIDVIAEFIANDYSILNPIQNMIAVLYKAYLISNNALVTKPGMSNNFDYSDLQLSNDYIDRFPFCGYYLLLHPEVESQIRKLAEIGNETSFPLSLLAFRVFTNCSIIKFHLRDIPPSSEELILHINNVLITNITSGKIEKFRNLIGFILEDPPGSFETNSSELFRSALLTVIANPEILNYKSVLQWMIISYLKENISEMICLLGSQRWDDVIRFNLAEKADDPFLKFLINPIHTILIGIQHSYEQKLKDTKKEIEQQWSTIASRYRKNYANSAFYAKLEQATSADEKKLMNKIRDQFFNIPETQESQELRKLIEKSNKIYRIYLSMLLNRYNKVLKEFPQSSYSGGSDFGQLKEIFSSELAHSYLDSDVECTIIAIQPEDPKKLVRIRYKLIPSSSYANIDTFCQTIWLMKIDPSKTPLENITVSNATISFYQFRYNSSFEPYSKKYTIQECRKKMDELQKSLDEIRNYHNEFQALGNVSVFFGETNTLEQFKQQLGKIDSDFTKSNIAASFERINRTNDIIIKDFIDLTSYFPIHFIVKNQSPSSTLEAIEGFKEFLAQSIETLKTMKVSDDLVDIEKQVNEPVSEFSRLRETVRQFRIDSNPTNSSQIIKITYKDSDLKDLNSRDLILPTIFKSEDRFCVNITTIRITAGPYYKGVDKTPFEFKLSNLTNENIRCVFNDFGSPISLEYHNDIKLRALTLQIPIDKIVFNDDYQTDLLFSGKIEFYSESELSQPFKEIPYNIVLKYYLPEVTFSMKNHYFSVEHGKASIIPFWAIDKSPIDICLSQPISPFYIRSLPRNEAIQPKSQGKQDRSITLQLSDESDQSHLHMDIHFGSIMNKPISISTEMDIHKPQSGIYLFDENEKYFQSSAAKNKTDISIGNIWRPFYIFIDYYNVSSEIITPFLSLTKSPLYEYRIKECPSFQPNKRAVNVYVIEAKLVSSYRRETKKQDVTLTAVVGPQKMNISFTFHFRFISVSEGRAYFPKSRVIPWVSYYDRNKNKFESINLQHSQPEDTTFLLSPISFYCGVRSDIKYDPSGAFLTVFPGELPISILLINPKGKIENRVTKGKFKLSDDNCLYLFGKITLSSGKVVIFPFYGEFLANPRSFEFAEQFIDSKETSTTFNLQMFIDWYNGFFSQLDEDLANQFKAKLNQTEFVFSKHMTLSNFSRVIYFFGKTIGLDRIEYVNIINAIGYFLDDKNIVTYYHSKKSDDLKIKFVSFISSIYNSMFKRYYDLQVRHFIFDLPFTQEELDNQQQILIEKCKIDIKTAQNSALKHPCNRTISEINNFEGNQKKLIERKIGTMSTSHIIKWTNKSGFSITTEEEKTISKALDVQTEPSDEAGNVSISSISYDSMNTIEQSCQLFNSIIQLTDQFAFSLYQCLQQNQDLDQIANQLTEIVHFYRWVDSVKKISPYRIFFDRFIQSFAHLMNRLRLAGLQTKVYNITNITANDLNAFVTFPKSINSLILGTQWEQHRKKPKPRTDSHPIIKQTAKSGHKKKFVDNSQDQHSFNKQMIKANFNHQKVTQTMPTVTGLDKEISNQDYLNDLLEQIQNPTKSEILRDFKSDKTHIPQNYSLGDKVQINEESLQKAEYFFNAAQDITSTIINSFYHSSAVLNQSDDSYASILVDCSNEISEKQKAALILISIAYANALSLLGIPYSLIIFCDSNFQFILKKIEEPHGKIFFLKLIEMINVKRRMSSMSDAIQMANQKIKFPKRNKHLIYVLSDGLSTSLNSPKEWTAKVLNILSSAVSFFFIDILDNDTSPKIIEVWKGFANSVKNAKSANSLFYSKSNGIFLNEGVYSIDNNEYIQPIGSCFVTPFIQLAKKNIKPAHKIKSIKFKTNDVIYPDDYVYDENTIRKAIELICNGSNAQEKKIFCTHNNPTISESISIEVPSFLPTSFCVQMTEFDNIDYVTSINQLLGITQELIESNSILEMSSYMFEPNKPTQYTPYAFGTLFNFPGLIRFLLTKGQDNKIFLAKKSGLVTSYSIYIVIDCSSSCFNTQSNNHAIQSILIILYILSKIDLPSVNLILTSQRGPIVLCSERTTFDALSPKSPLWGSLIYHLLHPHSGSYLDQALLATLAMCEQKKTLSASLLLFTDGNFSQNKLNAYNLLLEEIQYNNTEVLTIGIGTYSANITLLTQGLVWSLNPAQLVETILLLKQESYQTNTDITSLYTKQSYDVDQLEKYIHVEVNDLVFNPLFTELNRVLRKISVFTDFYSLSPDGDFDIQPGHRTQSQYIGKANKYKGVKVLLCLFWDSSMAKTESDQLTENVLINGLDDKKHISVINSLKKFGIETKIVKTYKDSIKEMKSGEYSQVWIICSRYDGHLPGSKEKDEAKTIEQYIDCLMQFWRRGGGLVFWTDNYPLTAEVNFFLEKAEFDFGDIKLKAQFRIGGSYPGAQLLKPSSKPKQASFAADEVIECDGYEKPLYNYYIKKLFEGHTIASAVKPFPVYELQESESFKRVDTITPFNRFSISSSKTISGLYYNSPLDSPLGDIVIDCGFSKLFYELTEEGVEPYVSNIAVFMLSLEKKASQAMALPDPTKCKPSKFDFAFKPHPQKYPPFLEFKGKINIIFMIDGTGSMEPFLKAVSVACNDIAKYMNMPNLRSQVEFKFGCVIYRDFALKQLILDERLGLKSATNNDEVEIFPLNSTIQRLQAFINSIKPRGGAGDGPEDWLSGYQCLIDPDNPLHFDPFAKKIVIHIADSPSHGRRFNQGLYTIPEILQDPNRDRELYEEMDREHDQKVPKILRELAHQGFQFFCICANGYRSTRNSFYEAKNIYNSVRPKAFGIQSIQNINDENEIFDTVKNIALQSIDRSVAVYIKSNDINAPPSHDKNKGKRSKHNYPPDQNKKIRNAQNTDKGNNHSQFNVFKDDFDD